MKFSLTDLLKLAVGIAPASAKKVVQPPAPEAKGEVCAVDGSCCGEKDACCGSGERHH